ncbi:MAG: hypothetical protein HWN81_16380 [Candidatus Lokiarchaeota archaeon]|nr:hypothetical protein [Candidatus Lokiarchaeota archaeon]
MDRCPSCGIEVSEEQVICVNCGVQLKALKVEKEGESEEEKKSPCWWVFLFILLPMLLIMFGIMFLPGLFA